MGRIAGGLLVALALTSAGVSTASAAPAWLSAEAPFGETEGELSTATMTPDGTAVSVRVAAVAPGEYELQARSRPPGGTFGPTEQIDRPVPTAVPPILVSGGDGSVAVVYGRNDGTTRASFRPPGGSFAPPRLLGAGEGPAPQKLALDDAGRLWFVHRQGQSVIATVLGPSGSATDLVVEAAPAGAGPNDPSIALAPGGEVRVAYEFLTSSACARSSEIRASDGGSGGFLSHSLLATASASGSGSPCTITGEVTGGPRIATTSDGATAVVYSRGPYGDPNQAVVARYRPAGGAWPQAASAAESIGAGLNPIPSLLGGGAAPVAVVASMETPTSLALSSRNPDGSWTPSQSVSGSAGGSLPSLAASPAGAGIVAWKQARPPYRMVAVTRSPAGALTAPAFTSETQDLAASLGGVGVDDEGNAVVGWSTHLGSNPASGYQAMVAGYDGAGPRFTSLAVPASGVAGEALGFSAAAVDVWSPVGPPSWQFGDGGSASGGAVSHSFGPGSYTVAAAVTDAVGNTTSATRPLRVLAAPRPAQKVMPAPDTTPPALTEVALKPKKVSRGKEAKLTFALSEAATVRVTLARGAKGTKRGRQCVKPQPKARARGKSCRRLVTVRSLAGGFGAGAGSLALPKTLALGGYRVTAVATDAAGNASPSATARLRVVKPKPKHKRPHR